MRLLILLSALLTALTGVVSGATTAAEPVQASATVAAVKPHVATLIALPAMVRARAFAGPVAWAIAADAPVQDGGSFGERRRL